MTAAQRHIHPIPPLQVDDDVQALLAEPDFSLLNKVYAICHDFCYHDKMSLDEKTFEYAVTPDAAGENVEFWCLLPPLVTSVTAAQLDRITAAGHMAGDLISMNEITVTMDTSCEPRRLSIAVRIQLSKNETLRVFDQTLIVSTKTRVVQRSIANVPAGFIAHRQQDGTAFTNSNNPRNNKRARASGVGGGGGDDNGLDETRTKRGRGDPMVY